MTIQLNFLVNLHHEYMDLSMTLSMMWTDERLEWNKTAFSGVDYIQAAADDIWYPDLEVQNRLLDYPLEDLDHHTRAGLVYRQNPFYVT